MGRRITFSIKALIQDPHGRVLILRRNTERNTVWELPGGHLEFGETAEQAVTREVFEETGMNIIPEVLVDTWNAFLDNWHITGIIYKCSTENFDIKLSDEHVEFRWAATDEPDFELLIGEFREKVKTWLESCEQ